MSVRVAAIALAVLLLPAATPLILPDNDAGPGVEASNDRDAPTPLAAYGRYAGNLTVGGDADWYAPPGGIALSGPYCVEADATGPAIANVTLAVDAVFARHEVRRVLTPASLSVMTPAVEPAIVLQPPRGLHMGVALPPIRGSLVGFETTDPGATGGGYTFDVRGIFGADFGEGDGGLGGDAPASTLAAPGVARACMAGSLDPEADDLRDVFSFDGFMGEQVTLTWLTLFDAKLHVLDPLGNTIAIVDNATATTIVLDSTGPWFLAPTVASGERGGWWAMGFTDDPGGQGCRPMCLDTR